MNYENRLQKIGFATLEDYVKEKVKLDKDDFINVNIRSSVSIKEMIETWNIFLNCVPNM